MQEIPIFLRICFKCAYPTFNKYLWKDAKVGDKVYLAGNKTPIFSNEQGGLRVSPKQAPFAYGPHTIHDIEKRQLLSGNNGKVFNEPEDTLLSKK